VQTALSERQRTQAEFMKIKAAEDSFRMNFREILEDYMRKLHETPIAPDIAALVGLADNSKPARDFAAPVFVEAPTAPSADTAAARSTADADDAGARGDAAAKTGEATGPIDVQPERAPLVQGLTLGEVESPEIELDVPVFDDPTEFTAPRIGAAGQRDDDLDIEQID
jgi:hypothetical protein